MIGERYEKLIHRVNSEQARAIGSWVLGITYMKKLGEFISETEAVHTTIDPINGSTKMFLARVRDSEFGSIRESFDQIKPDSNAHIARWRMGIAGKTRENSLGNRYFVPNKEFIVATYYHEDSNARDKINANAGVIDLIESEEKQFVDFYLQRATVQLATRDQAVHLADVIHDARLDMEFWLSQSA